MLGILTALALLPAAPLADEYVFSVNTTRLVWLYRREGGQIYYMVGFLDAAGNFVPRGKGDGSDGTTPPRFPNNRPNRNIWNPNSASYSGIPNDVGLNSQSGRAVYEYRSGALVPGWINDRLDFVPGAGGTVLDLRDYLKDYPVGESRLVGNLPGFIHPKGTPAPLSPGEKAQLKSYQDYQKWRAERGFPPLPPYAYNVEWRHRFLDDPPAAARPPAAPAPPAPVPPGEFEFVPDTDRRVELRRRYGDKEYWYLGRLDAAGNFEFDSNYIHRTGTKPAGTPQAMLLNPETLGPCYEYRSGRLIKGRIDDKLNFVPEVGSRVIELKHYRYGPGALPIWNLPGYFQKK